MRFKALVEKHFNCPIKTLYSDNRGEYQALSSFLTLNGVSHLTSLPHTPEHNGFSERRHHYIVETGLSLLSHTSMPLAYWPFAFSTAVYLINHLPTHNLQNVSPYFKLFGHLPNYNKLWSFSCLCYPWLRPYTSHKLESRSSPCVFVGYSPTQSTYFCLDLSNNHVYVSRHVRFVESIFPFTSSQPTLPRAFSSTISDWCSLTLLILHSASPLALSPILPSNHLHNTDPALIPDRPVLTATEPSHSLPISFSSRSASTPVSPKVIMTCSKHNICKPIQKVNLTASLYSSSTEPTTVTQALKDPRWHQAMSTEFDALIWNGTKLA